MTFYWWSHWFWITLLYNVCMSGKLAKTFPSQEISTTEGNHNEKTNRAVTKLYQALGTSAWSTSVSPYAMDRTVLTSILPKPSEMLQEEAAHDVDAALMDYVQHENIADVNYADEVEDATEKLNMSTANEYKRSVEVFANATQNASLTAMAIKLQKDEVSDRVSSEESTNFTHFSGPERTNSTINHNTTTLPSRSSNATVQPLAATPSAPKITNIDGNLDAVQTITHLPVPQQSHLTTLQDISAVSLDDNDIQKAPFTLENANKEDVLRRAEHEHRTRKPKVLSAEYKQINRVINYSTDSKSLLTRSASTAPNIFEGDDDNIIASEALSVQRTYFLDAGAISAICLTVFGVCCTVGTIGIVLYRRRYLNKPQTLSEPDSSVYIDDSTMRVSDNSDEMYSLDNDSFLNSLEAMTIQNYWTDTVKHTKL